MEILFTVIISLAILIVLILMLNIPLSVTLKAEEKVDFDLSLFRKKIKPKKKKEKENKKPEKPDIIKLSKLVFSERQGIFDSVKYLFKKAVVKDFKLHIKVGSEDAAETALLYGGVCAVLYPAVAFLETVMTVKKDDIKIACDYENNQPYFLLSADIKIRVSHLLKTFFKVLPIIKKFIKEENKNDK